MSGISEMLSNSSDGAVERKNLMTDDDGFLLIEALIALAICSLAVVALVKFSQVSANVQNRTSVKAQAVLEARNLMDSVGSEIKLAHAKQVIKLPSHRTATITIEPYKPNLQKGTANNGQGFLYEISVIIETEQFGTVASLHAVRAHALY